MNFQPANLCVFDPHPDLKFPLYKFSYAEKAAIQARFPDCIVVGSLIVFDRSLSYGEIGEVLEFLKGM